MFNYRNMRNCREREIQPTDSYDRCMFDAIEAFVGKLLQEEEAKSLLCQDKKAAPDCAYVQ